MQRYLQTISTMVAVRLAQGYGSARPTQLLLAVMHDTVRIGANTKVVSGRQICMLQFWAYASAVASRLVLDHNNERSLAAM